MAPNVYATSLLHIYLFDNLKKHALIKSEMILLFLKCHIIFKAVHEQVHKWWKLVKIVHTREIG